MGNLVDELGYGYFQERFNGALFYAPDKRAGVIMGMSNDGVSAELTSGNVGKLSSEKVVIPKTFFTDMSVLAVPPLGWRAAAKGKFMGYYRRNNRSYQRGVSISNINCEYSEHTNFLFNTDDLNYSYYQKQACISSLILSPHYMTLREGLTGMRDGEIVGFAASANLAVLPHTEESNILMFNTTQVGTVDFNGNIRCTIPLVERMFKEAM